MTSTTLGSYVDGHWHEAGEPFADINPAHPDETLADAMMADAALAEQAVASAYRAFPTWRAMSMPQRGEILRRAADLIDARAKDIGRDMAREEGKTMAEGVGETRRAAALLRYYAGQALEPEGEVYPSLTASTLLYTRREPLGVVSAITPFNFPIAIPAWKIAPALVYGNTVVWKPAEVVPLTSVYLMQALIEAGLPEGVLNLVLGRGEVVGSVLTGDRRVDAVSFTGSGPVGHAVQREAVERGKKVQLELGGKNPAIVLADADLEQAATEVARGAFLSAGQKCTATSRVIVESAVAGELVERLADIARTWTLGDPLDRGTRIGPVVSEEQMNTVLGYLDQARQDGGRFAAGGARAVDLGSGYFVEPTVITDLSPGSRVVQEEIFGPVASVLVASSYDEAIDLANDTPFGLSASLFTRDLGRALRFAGDIRAGVVKVNQESANVEFQVPFGGMKGSSSGSREQGKVARDFFTQWKTVYIDPPAAGS